MTDAAATLTAAGLDPAEVHRLVAAAVAEDYLTDEGLIGA